LRKLSQGGGGGGEAIRTKERVLQRQEKKRKVIFDTATLKKKKNRAISSEKGNPTRDERQNAEQTGIPGKGTTSERPENRFSMKDESVVIFKPWGTTPRKGGEDSWGKGTNLKKDKKEFMEQSKTQGCRGVIEVGGEQRRGSIKRCNPYGKGKKKVTILQGKDRKEEGLSRNR